MKLHTASIALLLVTSFSGLAAFGCSSSTTSAPPSTDDAGACGATAVANTALDCGASRDDAGTCGAREVGSTCKKPDGACEAEVCVGSTWQCPEGDTSVPVVPGSCNAEPDGGTCGQQPIGSTCRKQGGGCEPLACIGTSWQCPAGDTQVPVVPGSCDVPDGG